MRTLTLPAWVGRTAAWLDEATTLFANTTITVLALAGTGIVAPALGSFASGALAGLSGIAFAVVFGAKAVASFRRLTARS